VKSASAFAETRIRKGAFPQEKVRKPLFATGTNQQVHFRRAPAQNFRQHRAERFWREFRDFIKPAGGVVDGFAGGVIDRQPKVQTRALGRRRFPNP